LEGGKGTLSVVLGVKHGIAVVYAGQCTYSTHGVGVIRTYKGTKKCSSIAQRRKGCLRSMSPVVYHFLDTSAYDLVLATPFLSIELRIDMVRRLEA